MRSRSWIAVGAIVFVVALAGSAIVVPQLRALHALQSLIYVAVIALDNAWALGAALAVAVAWNGLNLFVTHLAQAGAVAVVHGDVTRVDTMMVTLGTVGHFILIAGCVAAIRTNDARNTWWKLAGGGLIGLAYLAAIIAVAAPRT